jgi:hypothetical protein
VVSTPSAPSPALSGVARLFLGAARLFLGVARLFLGAARLFLGAGAPISHESHT